jgi:peptide chain release factor 1
LPEAEEVDVDLNENDIDMETMRSSGAGGQSVQKNETAVRLVHRPSGLVVTCQDERSLRQTKKKQCVFCARACMKPNANAWLPNVTARAKLRLKAATAAIKFAPTTSPKNRLTDHRINFKSNNLDQIMQGALDDLVNALSQARRHEALAA